MRRLIIIIIGLLGIVVPAQAQALICVEIKTTQYFPFIFGASNMAKSPFEHIENLQRKTADFPFDAYIVEVFTREVSVQLVGSSTIKRGVQIPDHITASRLRAGVPVKLTSYLDKITLLAVYDNLDYEENYVGQGSIVPSAPVVSVFATPEGWSVSWLPVTGADQYRVYRNDTADETSVDEVGYTPETSIVVGYESPYIYFAVKAVSGLNQSILSEWATDDAAPSVPQTFFANSDVAGHVLAFSLGNDPLAFDPSFKCLEIQDASDSSGTGAASLGFFFEVNFPYFIAYGPNTEKWYRARSVDWAGNVSDWTDWDQAIAGVSEIQDKFDGYGGDTQSSLDSLYWLALDNFDVSSSWTVYTSGGTISLETSNLKEGGGAVKQVTQLVTSTYFATMKKSVSLDLSAEGRFTDDDYVTFAVYVAANPSITLHEIYFLTSAGNYYSRSISGLSAGWNYRKFVKSGFSANGSPDWSNITQIVFYASSTSDFQYLIYDDLRIVKADPDDSATYNDTGGAWTFAPRTGSDPGQWHIYPGNRTNEPAKPFSLGQTDTAPTVELLAYRPIDTALVKDGAVQVGLHFKATDAIGGIAFFIKDATAGSWDLYYILAAYNNTTKIISINLKKYVGGTDSAIGSNTLSFTGPGIAWIGVSLDQYTSDAGRLKVYASATEGNLIQAENLYISTQDTEWLSDPGGSVGVLTQASNLRFVDFRAGSPAHAAVADVAYALNGPVLGPLVFAVGGELTISSGAVAVTHSHHTVDTESDAASDDLDTINGGYAGMHLILQAANSARTVVCKDGTGNLKLAGDCSLDNVEDTIALFRVASTWYELSRSDNGA